MPKVKFDKKQKAKTYSAYMSSCLIENNNKNTSNEFIQNGKNYTDTKMVDNFELNTMSTRFVPNVIFQMKQIPSNIS